MTPRSDCIKSHKDVIVSDTWKLMKYVQRLPEHEICEKIFGDVRISICVMPATLSSNTKSYWYLVMLCGADVLLRGRTIVKLSPICVMRKFLNSVYV